jgi:hypothetical protein
MATLFHEDMQGSLTTVALATPFVLMNHDKLYFFRCLVAKTHLRNQQKAQE